MRSWRGAQWEMRGRWQQVLNRARSPGATRSSQQRRSDSNAFSPVVQPLVSPRIIGNMVALFFSIIVFIQYYPVSVSGA